MSNTSCSTVSPSSCITQGQGCTSKTNYPQFIDSAACLCGLLSSVVPDPNGEQVEWWRCIGNANDNLMSGGTGKWYNTQLPSQELSGIGEPQNWSDNPADTSVTYVVEDINGHPQYVKFNGTSVQLRDRDTCCTGKNDTGLTAEYYHGGNGTNTTSSSTSSSTMSATSASSTQSPTTSPTTTGPSGPTGTQKSSTSAFKASLTNVLLLGLIIGPVLAMVI